VQLSARRTIKLCMETDFIFTQGNKVHRTLLVCSLEAHNSYYSGADKSLARPGRK